MTSSLSKKSFSVFVLIFWVLGAAGCESYAALPLHVTAPSYSAPVKTAFDEPASNPASVEPHPVPASAVLSTSAQEAGHERPLPEGGPLAPASCDLAAPGIPIDVTIPDDSEVQPGEPFTKIWRLLNAGTCTWTTDYSIAFFSGDAMSGPIRIFFPREVPPGDSIDLVVELTAPEQDGRFQGNWKLQNANREWFGIGPGGSAPFWVRVLVSPLEETIEPGILAEVETPQATPTAWIAAHADVSLALDSSLDLDYYPQEKPDGEDLRYQLDEQGQPVLAPLGNARIWVFGEAMPDLEDCLADRPLDAELFAAQIPTGIYLCYRTNLGLPGWIQVLPHAALSADTSITPPTDTMEPGETPAPTAAPSVTETARLPAVDLNLEIFTWSIP